MPASPKPLWLEWTVILLIRLMILVTRLIPLVWARALGRAVGAGLYYFNGRMRRVAIRNLELAYPEWTPSRRRVVARQSVQSTGELMSEMGRVWTQPWEKTAALLEVDGLDCVTETLASNLIRKSGAAPVMGAVLRTERGFRAVYRPAGAGAESDDALEALSAINLGVEKLIAGNERQYHWQYKRFRCRPKGLVDPHDWSTLPLLDEAGLKR